MATAKPAQATKGRGAKAAARAARIAARQRFVKARKAESAFARQLRAVARQVGFIVNGLAPKGYVRNMPELTQALSKYSDLLTPWAASVSTRLIAEIDQRDMNAWNKLGKEMGRALRNEVKTAPTGKVMRDLLDEQVTLIKSLPLQAAKRVHKLTIEAQQEGTRAAEVAQEIMKTGKVTESRAMLIARTEVARTASALTQARSEHVGSEGYIWRTSMDSDVRESHRKLEGKFIRWDDPPIADEEGKVHAHAGMIYNCRCYAEPVLPDVF